MDVHRVPLATRLFVYGFLAVFLYAGVAGVEAWPLTGWKLFSRVRTDRQAGWQAVSVDGAGVEHPIAFAELPRGYRGGPHLFAAFPSFSPARREAACLALAAAVRRRGRGETQAVRAVRAVRVYRTRRRAAPPSAGAGPGRRLAAATTRRSLTYECARAPA